MTKTKTAIKLAKDLAIGTKLKLTDGPSTCAYAVVVGHEETRWGHNCYVQIVESLHCEGRAGTVDTIHGSETLRGIGWQVCEFIVVNDEVREVIGSPAPLHYELHCDTWVKYDKAARAWVIGVEDQMVGVLASVRL